MHRAFHFGENVGDLFRGFNAVVGQLAHLAGYDGKSFSLFTGAGRFDGGVEAQEIGLLGDVFDEVNDVVSLMDMFLGFICRLA